MKVQTLIVSIFKSVCVIKISNMYFFNLFLVLYTQANLFLTVNACNVNEQEQCAYQANRHLRAYMYSCILKFVIYKNAAIFHITRVFFAIQSQYNVYPTVQVQLTLDIDTVQLSDHKRLTIYLVPTFTNSFSKT